MKYILHLTIALFFFLVTITASFAQGDAPTMVQGQAQTVKSVGATIKVPNSQATKLSASQVLLENGNKNILANPSFEHSSHATSWNGAIGLFKSSVEITSSVIDGSKAIRITHDGTASTADFSQDSARYADSFADGIQGIGMMWVKTSVTSTPLYVCPRMAGSYPSTISSSTCALVNADGKWHLYKVPYVLGSTSNGVGLTSNGVTVLGSYDVDDAFVGAVDLKQDINVIGPWQSFTPTGSWSTNTTYAGKWRQVGENMEIQYLVSTSGAPTSTQLSVNLPSGYTIDTSKLADGATPSFDYKYQLTTSCVVTDAATANYPCVGYYSSTTAIILRAENSSATYVANSYVTQAIPITFGSGDMVSVTAIMPVVQFSGASSVYSATNSDTGWTSSTCNGSWVTNTTYACKYRRKGKTAEIHYFVSTSGAPTATPLTVNLPSGLTIDTTALPSGTPAAVTQVALDEVCWLRDASPGDSAPCNVFYESTTSVNVRTYNTSGTYASAAATSSTVPWTWAASDSADFVVRVPIVGWEDSNVIIGTFNEVMTAPGITKPKTCSYAFGGVAATLVAPTECTSGTCTEVVDTCSAATPPVWGAAGAYSGLLFANGTWKNSSFLECTCSAYDVSSGQPRKCAPYYNGSQSWASTSNGGADLAFQTSNTTGTITSQDTYVVVRCEGQAP